MAEPSKTLREIVRVVASRFIGMVVIFLVIVTAVGAATFFAPKQYRSTVILRALPAKANPLEGEAASLRDSISLFVSTQRELITRDEVLAAALILLDGEVEGLPKPIPPGTGTVKWQKTTAEWDERVASYKNDNAEKVQRAKNSVSVVTPGGPDAQYTQTFTISVDWREDRGMFEMPTKASAEKAAEDAYTFADYLLDAYMYYYTRGGTESETRTVGYFKDVKVDKDLQFRKAEKSRADYLREKNLNPAELKYIIEGGVSGVETGLAAIISELDSKLIDTRMKVIDAQSLRRVITESLKSQPEEITIPQLVMAANPSIKTIEDKIVRLKLNLNSLTPRYTEDYKEIKDAKAEIEATYQQLHDEMARHGKKLDQDIQAMEFSYRDVYVELQAKKSKYKKLTEQAAEFQDLQAEYDLAKSELEEAKINLGRAQDAEMQAAKPVLVSRVSAPSRPAASEPRRPIMWLNILIAVAGGFIVALVYAFMADHFDHTIKGIDDTERYVGAPVLTSVPKLGRHIVRVK